MMRALHLRAAGDRDLAERLGREPEIRDAVERLARLREDDPGARRQLLATALRLGPGVAPELHAIVEECRARLEEELPVESYVYPEPRFNAGLMRPEKGRLLLLLSSGLVEAFEPEELRFVVGHELGHHVFDHHAIPVAALHGGAVEVSGPLALQVFAWQRYAEVSADRTGLLCAGALEGAARALLKLTSGLSKVTLRLDEFLAQAGDLEIEAKGGNGDWFATHPFSPLRLRVAKLFADSELFREGGEPRDQLEAGVAELMSIMEPSYLSDASDGAKAMRRLLFAGGVVVAAATDGISDVEIEALEKLLGVGALDSKLNVNAVREDLPRRIEDVRELVGPLKRAQVVRDLCVIALADGNADQSELRVLRAIAEQLGVDATLVDRTVGV
jgi:tellurite resistance protein